LTGNGARRNRWERRKREKEKNQPLSGGLGWPRRRATSRRRSSHQDYHPSLHSLPPVARWATLHATIHLTLLADSVPRTFSRATDRSRRPSVHPYVHPSVNLPLQSLCRYISAISQDVCTSVCVCDRARGSLIVRNACQICDIEPIESQISLKIQTEMRSYDVSFHSLSG